MTGAALRWGLVAAGLACAVVAWGYWSGGVPPLWSFAARRAQTVVTRTELGEADAPGGGVRQVAHVYVDWPPGSTIETELPGLVSPHRRWHLHVPIEQVRRHPAGSPITVRVVAGRPVADRIDLHELAYALLATLFAGILTLSGIALIVARWRRGRQEALP